MLFYSTNGRSPSVSFSQALLTGQAPDRGLYMPQTLPAFRRDEIDAFAGMEYHEIAMKVISRFTGNEIEQQTLQELIKDAYNFDVPIEKIVGNSWVMRLDRGPTASFKDFAARMMGRMMNHFTRQAGHGLTILTATSGDTGSAIANAFCGLEGIRVVVLFPRGEVSDRQRKQMTTLGSNITIIELGGKFDDCQALVKEAFADRSMASLNLSSANSINIGRLIPQIVYYFYAFAKLRSGADTDNIIISVPSGNFGDMMGGMFAMNLGLPVKKFVIAVNGNDEFPKFLGSGRYEKIEPSISCLSNAMNVGHPSNLARLVDMYGGHLDEKGQLLRIPDMEALRRDIWSVSVSDSETRDTIGEVYRKYGVVLEPHGAVGWRGLELFKKDTGINDNQLTVTLETAHPAKFPDEVRSITGIDPVLPPSLEGLDDRGEHFEKLDNDYNLFRKFLLERYG